MSSPSTRNMSRHEPGEDLVIAISTDDTFLHVNRLSGLLAHMEYHVPDPQAEPDERVLELFDTSGRRLRPVLNPDLHVIDLRPEPGEAPAPEELQARVGKALDLAQAKLDANPHLGSQPAPLPTATQVPRPAGTLRETAADLAAEFDLKPGTGHRAGWFHNLFHV